MSADEDEISMYLDGNGAEAGNKTMTNSLRGNSVYHSCGCGNTIKILKVYLNYMDIRIESE